MGDEGRDGLDRGVGVLGRGCSGGGRRGGRGGVGWIDSVTERRAYTGLNGHIGRGCNVGRYVGFMLYLCTNNIHNLHRSMYAMARGDSSLFF